MLIGLLRDLGQRLFAANASNATCCALNAGEKFWRGLLFISCSSLCGPISRPGYGETALIDLFSFAGLPLAYTSRDKLSCREPHH